MVKDIKYIIKRIIIGVGIAIALIYLKGGLIADVNALSLRTYDSNWNITGQCSNCNCLVPYDTIGNIKDLYIIYDDVPLSNGTKYKLETTFTIITQNATRPAWGSIYFYNSGTNQNIQTTYWARNSEELSPYPDSTQGVKLNYGYIGTFTSTKSGNGGLLELPLNTQITYAQICVLTKSFGYMGDSTTDAINNQTNQIINNNNQNTNNIINNQNENTNSINNNLTDDTSPSDSDIEDLFDLDTDDSNSPVSDLLLMPLTLLNAFNNGFSGTCSSVNLGNLYGTNLVLPCIQVQNYLGSTLWNLIDMMFCIFLIYNMAMMFVQIYEGFTTLRDDFDVAYSPKHHDTSTRVGRGESEGLY